VVTGQIGRDLEGIAGLLGEAMPDGRGPTPLGEQPGRRVDIGARPFVPLLPQIGGGGLDSHAHRLRARPVEPRRIGDGEPLQFGSGLSGDVDRVLGDGGGRTARAKPDKNPFDHGCHPSWNRSPRIIVRFLRKVDTPARLLQRR